MAEGLNQMIALHGRGLNLDPAGQLGRGQQVMAGFQDLQMQPLRKKEAELRLAALEQENEANTDEFKIRDLATDAIKIKPLLESGDLTRANTMIAERIQKIMQRGGDPADTMAFRDALNSGQITPQQAAAELGMEIEAAQRYGVFSQGNVASSRTYEPVPMYENGKFTGMGIPTFDPRTGQARYTPIQGGQTVDPATLAGMKAGSSQTAQNVSDLEYKPKITSAETGAKLGVEGKMRPEIEAKITKARAEAEDLVAQTISKRSSANSLDAAQVLKTNLTGNLDKIYGRGESLYPDLLRSQKGIDMIADRNQLVGMLTLAGRGQLKGQGPLTDQEQKTVQQAISVLSNPDISPARAEIALNDAFKVLETAAGRPAQPAGQPAQQGQYTQGQIIEAGGKRYRVIGGDPNDPDIEEIP